MLPKEAEALDNWEYAHTALTAEQKKEVKVLFKTYDVDKSGRMTEPQFIEGLMRLGYQKEELEAEFHRAHHDGAGLTLEQFETVMQRFYYGGRT